MGYPPGVDHILGDECGDPMIAQTKKATHASGLFRCWLREPDLNRRPSGYEPDELPDCSIPRLWGRILQSTDEVSS